jgi:NAD(P)H-flavin reductase
VKINQANILDIVMINKDVCLRLEGSALLQTQTGQYFQAFASNSTELLPVSLYPCGSEADQSLYSGDFPKSWQPGTELHIRGPRGNGFHLPPLARRIALTTLDEVSINRLLPLAEQALKNGAEVTLLTNTHPAQLALEIEVLPLGELGQIKTWADYLAAIIPYDKLTDFNTALVLIPGRPIPFYAEVMLNVSMICDESSTCGVCAVYTAKGWRYACKDGPVFTLEELSAEETPHE